MSQSVEARIEQIANEILTRTVSYRRKLRYSYRRRNVPGFRRAGYRHLWRIDLDDLDAHLVSVAWRIARWTQTTNTITDLAHLTMSALKFYLKEITRLFRSQKMPKWLFYPIGVNQFQPQKDDDPDPWSNSVFTAVPPNQPVDPEEPDRLHKALRWAKKQIMKQMKLTRQSPEYTYLQFMIGLIQAGLPMYAPLKKGTILPQGRVGYLKRQFVRYVRQWYAEHYAHLIP